MNNVKATTQESMRVYLDKSLKDAFTAIAEAEHRSVSGLMVVLIADFIENYKPKEKKSS